MGELLATVAVDPNTGKIVKTTLKRLQAEIERAVEVGMGEEISGVEAFVDPNQDILSTGVLKRRFTRDSSRHQPYYSCLLGFSNPNLPSSNGSFNSNDPQYAWSDVRVLVGGQLLTAIQSISYKYTQEKEYVFGGGDSPLAIQRGNKTYEGSVKLLQSELDKLVAKAPSRDLMAYRNLTITIGYEDEAGHFTSDTLVGVEFKEVDKVMEQNKKFMEVELPIMFLRIKYDA